MNILENANKSDMISLLFGSDCLMIGDSGELLAAGLGL